QPRAQQKQWIARDDRQQQYQWRPRRKRGRPQMNSSRFLLFGEITKSFFGFAHIVERQLARFNQVRHDRLRASTEQTKELVNQPALRSMAGDDGLKNMSIADLLHAAQYLLLFHA